MSTTRKYVRRSRQQWAELIGQQPGSGLNVSQFCKQEGVSYQSFQSWRKSKRSFQTVLDIQLQV